MNYWDTSTLLKLYVREADSDYFIELVNNSSSPLLVSDLARVELDTSLHRKGTLGELEKSLADAYFQEFSKAIAAGRVVTVPLNDAVIVEARQIIRHTYSLSKPMMIRSLDVIHVASALVSKASTIVATDTRLREVAALMGLQVIP